MSINKTLFIQDEKVWKYNGLMQADTVDYEKNGIQRYATVTSRTVDMGNGHEADIKVCSSGDGDPLWCEGVLFLNGCECCCTEVDDRMDGMYCFEHNGKKLNVIVEVKDT